MADDKHYVPGDYYRICDRTGFKVRASKTRLQWDNAIVRDQSWEPRQPQDFVTGVRDDQTVPMPRPRQVSPYEGPLCTSVSAAAALNDITLNVISTARMYAGDTIGVILDNGIAQRVLIGQITSSTVLTLQDPLQFAASIGNAVANYSAISPPNIG